MSQNELRFRYELTAIFGSKIRDQNFEQFGHEFLTDQQTARSYYELVLRDLHESKYVSATNSKTL